MSKNRTLADFISTSSVSAEEIANGAVTVVKLANTTSSNGTSFIQMSGHSTALNITPAGNVGIGTNNPAAELHVNSSGQAIARVEGSNEYYSGMMIRNNYASQQSQWHVAAAGGSSGWGAVNGNFIIRDDTKTLLV